MNFGLRDNKGNLRSVEGLGVNLGASDWREMVLGADFVEAEYIRIQMSLFCHRSFGSGLCETATLRYRVRYF